MKIEIKDEDLDRAFGEFFQLKGMAIAVIDSNVKKGINFKPDATIENSYPIFCWIAEEVKNEINK